MIVLKGRDGLVNWILSELWQDPLIVPEVEPSAEQILQAGDGEGCRVGPATQ